MAEWEMLWLSGRGYGRVGEVMAEYERLWLSRRGYG